MSSDIGGVIIQPTISSSSGQDPVRSNPGRWKSKKEHQQHQPQAINSSQTSDMSDSSSSTVNKTKMSRPKNSRPGHLQPATLAATGNEDGTSTSSSPAVQGNGQQQQQQGGGNKGPKQPKKQQPATKLSATAPSFIPLDDFVPVYRPPEQQLYNQQRQQQLPPSSSSTSANVSIQPTIDSGAASTGGRKNKQQPRPSNSPPPSGSPTAASSRGRGGKQQHGEKRERMDERKAAESVTTAASSSSSAVPAANKKKSEIWREGHKDNSLLAKTITEQLMTNSYDCSICSEPIGRRGKIWSCDQCHIIIHLSCINKWYETNRAQNLGDTSYRCPGCQFIRTESPGDSYYCFCGKTFEPEYSPFLTPHSCGKNCGHLRNCGIHTCSLPCHPGHCSKCVQPGPMSTCACGATERRLKCGEQDSEKPTCGQVCNKLLNCGTHRCTRSCHNGPCDTCAVQEDLTCFCGQTHELRICGQSGTIAAPSSSNPDLRSFECANICSKQLNCGNCQCKLRCHAGPCAPCVRQPPIESQDIQTCGCGKHSHTLEEIQSDPELKSWIRTSCKDPLPICSKSQKCGKLLNCSFHTCQRTCHDTTQLPCGLSNSNSSSSSSSSSSSTGSYSVGCNEMVKRQCRCAAANIVEVPCTSIRGDTSKGIPPPKDLPVFCDTKCRAKLACKKHTCPNICCPRGESHVCLKVCGKPLECGKHNCDAFCHLGACRPCGVIYREGIRCTCGRTSTAPGTRCGTAIPNCPYPCSNRRPCGHPCIQVCHERECAPCVTLVEKMCAGGHKMMKSIPCYASPSCGITCKKILRCGVHSCAKPCHTGACTVALGSQVDPTRKGWSISPSNAPAAVDERKAAEEVDDGSIKSCLQKCGLPRSDCGHACQAQCHPNQPCPTNVPCKENVRIYCDCKRLSKVVPCGGLSGGVGLRSLQCVAQCEVETRNARFRDALQLDENRVSIPYPAELLDQIIALDLFDFLVRSERMLAEFLGMTSGQTKTFPPMSTNQRWILHQLSAYYNMESESFDFEPKRSVRVTRSAISTEPKMKLSEAIKLYRATKGGSNSSTRGTITQSSVFHIWDLDQEPVISPSDLNVALKPYAYDHAGAPNQNFRVNWLDHSHAMVVFHDASLSNNIRLALERRNLFRTEPDDLASKQAREAFSGAYRSNSLFRRHHDSTATGSLASSKKRVSSFDEWSESRSVAAVTTATPTSSWHTTPTPTKSGSYTSDHLSDEELAAFLATTVHPTTATTSRSTLTTASTSTSTSSTNSSSTSTSSISLPVASGVVALTQPALVSTTNRWSAMEDDDEEEEGEVTDGTTRKQRRRAAAAAAAAALATSTADSSSPIADDWQLLATQPKRKGSNEPPTTVARDAFDD